MIESKLLNWLKNKPVQRCGLTKYKCCICDQLIFRDDFKRGKGSRSVHERCYQSAVDAQETFNEILNEELGEGNTVVIASNVKL